jgi:hypothetical protein
MKHMHAILKAAGYEHEFVPAQWEDTGDVENGPRLDGHPDMDVWTVDVRKGVYHEIIIIDHEVVNNELQPAGPEDF